MSPPSVHVLVPKIVLASEDEVRGVLAGHRSAVENLPLIKADDAGLKLNGVEAKAGDVVKCLRSSQVTGKEAVFYRRVVE